MKSISQQVIHVNGEEADIVLAADEIIQKAEMSSCNIEQDTGLVVPINMFENKKDGAIVAAYDRLTFRYQNTLDLSKPPILYARSEPNALNLASNAPMPSSGIHYYEFTRRANNPTNMDLEQFLLGRVELRRYGETIYQYERGYYRRLSTVDLRTLIHKLLREELSRSGQARQLKDVETLLMAEPIIEGVPIDLNPQLICLENGVLNTSTMTLLPHSPSHFFTSKLHVRWEPHAVCPTFDQFLHTVTGGDPVLQQRFLEAIGYVLVPDNRAKRFLLLQGLGDTGKSVLGLLLAEFFDPSDVAGLDLFRFGDRFSLSSLVDKRLNVSMDLTDSALNEQAVSVIKQLTGQDLVQVEEKYKAPYSAHITCKLVFGTNHALRLNASDRAFMRRILYLPFQYPVPPHRRIHGLVNILANERNGIFKKALYAYLGLVNRGYQFAGDDLYQIHAIPQCGNIQMTLEQGISDFISAMCSEDPNSLISTEDLHRCYLQFCTSARIPSCDNRQQFSAKFQSLASTKLPSVSRTKKRVDGKPQNVYVGVKIAGFSNDYTANGEPFQ